MLYQFVLQRLVGLQAILNGVHAASRGLSSATIGSERAAFIDQFLSQVFPPIYRFGSGDATDSRGVKSGQLDVVVEFPFGPSLPMVGNEKSRLYLAETIAAVVEIKSNLANQWNDAVQTADVLATLQRNIKPTIVFGPNPGARIPLFAVGYTGWSSKQALKDHLDRCPNIDGALIIERGVYVSRNMTADGPWALWALISDLHHVTSSLQSAFTSPLSYCTVP